MTITDLKHWNSRFFVISVILTGISYPVISEIKLSSFLLNFVSKRKLVNEVMSFKVHFYFNLIVRERFEKAHFFRQNKSVKTFLANSQ